LFQQIKQDNHPGKQGDQHKSLLYLQILHTRITAKYHVKKESTQNQYLKIHKPFKEKTALHGRIKEALTHFNRNDSLDHFHKQREIIAENNRENR
jgi:hypothetical protein